MESCTISYIPEYLHTNNKPVLSDFSEEEKLFRRANKSIIPFADLKPLDISVNRSGTPEHHISDPDDVLWDLKPGAQNPKIAMEVVELSIKILYPQKPLSRLLCQSMDNTYEVKMTLIHDPLPCNYSHSMLVFDLNNERITHENYQDTLGHNKLKKIRQACRDEISKAIIKKEIAF